MSHSKKNQCFTKAVFERDSKIKEYTVIGKIGQGAYANVYKAYKSEDKNEVVAIKCLEKSKLSQSAAIENILNEIKILKMLKHPHIVAMKEFHWDERFIYIIIEYCDGGDLSKFIKKRHKLPEKTFQLFFKQLAMALSYLRSFNISHLDLKPSNLLIVTHPTYTLKVGDFGFARFLSNETYQCALRGSPLYMAPEMLVKRQFDPKCDLWSVGIIAYECLFGRAPFSSCNFKELRGKLSANTPIKIPENADISRQCRELLKRLLKYNPEERIDFEQFFSHPYVDVAHHPSPKTYGYAVDLLHQAVKHDSKKEFKEAFNLYCDAISYLIPHINDEKDQSRRDALKVRVIEYTNRAEALLAVFKMQPQAESKKNLKDLCSSTPALVTALDMGKSADLYLSEGDYTKAQELYEMALEMLIDLLPKEPTGVRKDRLLKQADEWLSQAYRTKALYDMNIINTVPEVDLEEVDKEMCVLQ